MKTKTNVKVGVEVKLYPDKTFEQIKEEARIFNEEQLRKNNNK